MATLLLRTVEGRVLTSLEVDNNFSNLNIEIADVGNNLANAEGNVGIVTNLTTTATDNLVEAINEIEANVNALGSMSLQSNANVNIAGTGYIDISNSGNTDDVLGRITASSMVCEGELFLGSSGIDGFGLYNYGSNIGGIDSSGNTVYLSDNTAPTNYFEIDGNVRFQQGGAVLFDGPIIMDVDFPTPTANGNITYSMLEQGQEISVTAPASNLFINIEGADNTLPSSKVMYINVYVDNFGDNIFYPKSVTIGNLNSSISGTETNMNVSWEGGVVPSVPPGSDMLYTFRIRTFTGGFVVYGSSRIGDII